MRHLALAPRQVHLPLGSPAMATTAALPALQLDSGIDMIVTKRTAGPSWAPVLDASQATSGGSRVAS